MSRKHKYLLALFIVAMIIIAIGQFLGHFSTLVSVISFAVIAELALWMGLFDLKSYIHKNNKEK